MTVLGCVIFNDNSIKNYGRDLRLQFSLQEARETLACLYRNPGRFYMLQLNSVDSGHFTQLELSIGWSDLHEIKNKLGFVFRFKKEYVILVKVAQLGPSHNLTLLYL